MTPGSQMHDAEMSVTAEQRHRWATVLDYLIAAMPVDDGLVCVDGDPGPFAGRLADRLRENGRSGVEVVPGSARAAKPGPTVAWQLTGYDDPPHRFHAIAVRR